MLFFSRLVRKSTSGLSEDDMPLPRSVGQVQYRQTHIIQLTIVATADSHQQSIVGGGIRHAPNPLHKSIGHLFRLENNFIVPNEKRFRVSTTTLNGFFCVAFEIYAHPEYCRVTIHVQSAHPDRASLRPNTVRFFL
jgi:hypothetical protein